MNHNTFSSNMYDMDLLQNIFWIIPTRDDDTNESFQEYLKFSTKS